MANRRFTPLRTDDSDLSRVQDEVARALNPALASLDALGAAPTWITPTLLNGWVNFGSPLAVVGYYKDASGRVWVGGSVINGTLAAAVLTFSAGYRPSATRGFPVSCGVVPAYAIIASAGVLTINGAAGVSAAGVSLDGISFLAER